MDVHLILLDFWYRRLMGDATMLAARFAALGHPARLRIVRQLLAAAPQGQVVGELQQTLGMPGSTLSHHLDALSRHRLIDRQREGRFLRYRADRAVLRSLLASLSVRDGESVRDGLPAADDRDGDAARAPDTASNMDSWRAW